MHTLSSSLGQLLATQHRSFPYYDPVIPLDMVNVVTVHVWARKHVSKLKIIRRIEMNEVAKYSQPASVCECWWNQRYRYIPLMRRCQTLVWVSEISIYLCIGINIWIRIVRKKVARLRANFTDHDSMLVDFVILLSFTWIHEDVLFLA